VQPDLSVSDGHTIAHRAEERIKDSIKTAAVDVVVHIEPLGSEADT
jgi:divalent metal cation (Fe/Co/Zn/Cd) transporter